MVFVYFLVGFVLAVLLIVISKALDMVGCFWWIVIAVILIVLFWPWMFFLSLVMLICWGIYRFIRRLL